MFPTNFEFTLPKGYLDGEGNLHRKGVMRLAKAVDEIVPMRDPRVRANPAYATVIVLSRVITQLGILEEINPSIIEELYASDLNYLYNLYRRINDLDQPEETLNTVNAPIEEFSYEYPSDDEGFTDDFMTSMANGSSLRH
jgi:hypothetical protein